MEALQYEMRGWQKVLIGAMISLLIIAGGVTLWRHNREGEGGVKTPSTQAPESEKVVITPSESRIPRGKNALNDGHIPSGATSSSNKAPDISTKGARNTGKRDHLAEIKAYIERARREGKSIIVPKELAEELGVPAIKPPPEPEFHSMDPRIPDDKMKRIVELYDRLDSEGIEVQYGPHPEEVAILTEGMDVLSAAKYLKELHYYEYALKYAEKALAEEPNSLEALLLRTQLLSSGREDERESEKDPTSAVDRSQSAV